MVIENAIITVDPDRASAFEAAVTQAAPIFHAADGCGGMALERLLDQPGVYRLRVHWASVDHHKVVFWQSEGFQQWRTLVAGFFTFTPVLEYSEAVDVGS